MLPHYKAKQVSVNRRRHYEVNGQRLPGVTTILSATKPWEDKERLWRWRERVGTEEANRITAKSSRAGTKIHRVIKAYLRQEEWALPEGTAGFWASIEPVLQGIEEVLLVEGAVWHPLKFAGFPDALMVYDGQLVVCDWKTARHPKQVEWMGDYFLQVAAYCWAVNWVYRDHDIKVERAMVAIALEDTPAQLFTLTPDKLDQYWGQFQQRLRQYYRLKLP
ncbi:PD-(D/E)XK nuclease family protein [Leptothoe sp. PORK10 BA2]|uniref:PD-(D/E)XK nuclease family protein n=1 Tax=Leptothoe sp. PORK10 BA2 TaxID=3110254 RepID=UPI002B1F37C0|nr:PD-(D/E)XK nuclease family protein [Leptothoe sp. PORK10 BA2]MEA5462306.1 PD-(D/E)XK nuclease family protein [Leptothoe sp. PORK10 BA2]